MLGLKYDKLAGAGTNSKVTKDKVTKTNPKLKLVFLHCIIYQAKSAVFTFWLML